MIGTVCLTRSHEGRDTSSNRRRNTSISVRSVGYSRVWSVGDKSKCFSSNPLNLKGKGISTNMAK